MPKGIFNTFMQILVEYGKKNILKKKLFSKEKNVLQDYFFKIIFFTITFYTKNYIFTDKAGFYVETTERNQQGQTKYRKDIRLKKTV